MPRYWFTTHWPRFKDGHDTLNIYIQDRHKEYADRIAPHDRVLLYEFKSGPARILSDGRIQKRVMGKEGVICECEVSTCLQERDPESIYEKYVDGREARWAWIAKTGNRREGFLNRKRTNEILGYKRGNNFFGFNRGRGIIEIAREKYDAILAEFH